MLKGGVEGSVGYKAAREGAGILLREDRGFLQVTGSAPGEMLKGILSGRIPQTMVPEDGGRSEGLYAYSTILTPKGKMVTDLHLLPTPTGDFLMVLPLAGMEGALAHFKKYLHPRFAQLRERTDDLSYLSIVGPAATEVASRVLQMDADFLPDHGRVVSLPLSEVGPVILLGDEGAGSGALHLLLPAGKGEALRAKGLEEGGEALTMEDWNTLRIEEGRPLFGAEMTTEIIPVEARIHDEAIDYEKGCYTGQEVIIRLRDRGQVNKRLCLLLLGQQAPPAPGESVFSPDSDRRVGWITSSCRSPKLGQTIALGFIKRSVELGDRVALGGPQGPSGEVAPPR
jgi:folate-binding protein YgfZ